MSNSQTISSFAIAGVGRLGSYILKSLAAFKPQPSIVVITRQTSKPDLPDGVKIATVDYDDPSTITRALQEHKVEAVISVITTRQVNAQYPLVKAAKAAGVRLFAPAEFGLPSHGVKEGPFVAKNKLIEHLQTIELPYILFYAGCWIDNLPLVLALHTGKAHIIGKGETPTSFTARQDIGDFVAHALTSFPLPKLQNAIFRIESQRATLQDVAKIFNKPVEYTDTVPAIDSVLGGFLALLQRQMEASTLNAFWDWNKGRALTEEEVKGENAQELWKEHVWNKIGELQEDESELQAVRL